MKKIAGLLFAAALTFGAYAQKQASLPIGANLPGPPYYISDVMSETKVSPGTVTTNRGLLDLKTDNGLLVIFTCNTCPFVLKNKERTKEILTYAKDKGIGVLLVNSNEAQREGADALDKMLAYGKEQNYPNYYEDKLGLLADAFGASHTPEVFLFSGKTDKLVYKGAMDDSPSDPQAAKNIYLKDAMTQLLAGQSINPAETKSVGCSIKRLQK